MKIQRLFDIRFLGHCFLYNSRENQRGCNMKGFDKVIGYASIKSEIMQICDVIKNREKYQKLGVKIPKGLLLHGDPGVGKTLIANAFIEECGRNYFVCRKNLPDDDFIRFIKTTFEDAQKNAPSLILLDDFDKFANEDNDHKNAEEYVTIQSCIDEVTTSDVFVIATANSLDLVPDSLLRVGCFDTTIEIKVPKGIDAEKILQHYLSDKNVAENLDVKELARILNGRTCAELETIINQAGIYAGYQNKNKITFDDIVRACIRTVYNTPETIKNETDEDDEKTAYHEAGHALIAEKLEPGSVTMISIGGHEGSSVGGFTSYCRDEKCWKSVDLMKNRVTCLLGGRCATEIKYGDIDAGCLSDIDNAVNILKRIIVDYAGNGFDKCITGYVFNMSETLKYNQEKAVCEELQRCYLQAKRILVENRQLLDKLANEIKDKKLLISKDVQKILND